MDGSVSPEAHKQIRTEPQHNLYLHTRLMAAWALPLHQSTVMLACVPRKRTSDQQFDEEVADQTQTRDRSDANLQAGLRAAWPSEPLLLITKYASCNDTHFTTSMSLLSGEGITDAGLLVNTKYDVPASLVESLLGLQSPAAPRAACCLHALPGTGKLFQLDQHLSKPPTVMKDASAMLC